MSFAKRLGAQLFTAPIGTKLGEPGWTPLHDVSQVDIAPAFVKSDLTAQVREISSIGNLLAEHYLGRSSQRWITGIAPPTERSEPLGLTRDYTYDDGDNAYISVHPKEGDEPEDVVALIEAPDGVMPYVRAKDSVPIALNILGRDRPTPGASVMVAVGRHAAGYTSDAISGSDSRDRLLVAAIANLLAIDAYDQRCAESKAEAKRKADYEASKLESLNRSKAIFEQTLTAAALGGASAESAAKVQMALSAYDTARRKYEGLPH